MQRGPAPANVTCCVCQKPIPEGEECFYKTIIIASIAGQATIEDILKKGTPVTAYAHKQCADDPNA